METLLLSQAQVLYQLSTRSTKEAHKSGALTSAACSSMMLRSTLMDLWLWLVIQLRMARGLVALSVLACQEARNGLKTMVTTVVVSASTLVFLQPTAAGSTMSAGALLHLTAVMASRLVTFLPVVLVLNARTVLTTCLNAAQTPAETGEACSLALTCKVREFGAEWTTWTMAQPSLQAQLVSMFSP